MRIQRLVGTVSLYDENGGAETIREKMRLSKDQSVATEGRSLIMVSLDETKLLTMEEDSRAQIRAFGKKLEFHLTQGNLFFNVTKKLGDNESLDVHTSTMVCGIRGTSAYVGHDATGHEVIMVTDGEVHVIATNPVTKETIEADIASGIRATVYLDEEAKGNATISLIPESFREEDLPAMALDTIRKNPALMDRVSKATGFSTKKLTLLAQLSCVEGESMYGVAADELKENGIEDSIPYMGDVSDQMVASANSAADIAGDDLPLEAAILTGYSDVTASATGAGYTGEDLAVILTGTRTCVEDTMAAAGDAGAGEMDRLSIAMSVSDTVSGSVSSMVSSGLTSREIRDVVSTSGKLYTNAILSGKAAVASVGSVSDHITSTVAAEMGRSSNGDETVVALLRTNSSPSGSSSGPKKSDEHQMPLVVASADNTVPPIPASAVEAAPGESPETAFARSMIVATDPNTGIMALSDGTFFDPVYYASNNPEAFAECGTDTVKLLAHYLGRGRLSGADPVAPPTPTPVPEWVIKMREQEQNNSDSDDDDDDDDDDDSNSTPPPPPGLAAATTATFNANNEVVNSSGTTIGTVSNNKFVFNGSALNVDFPLVIEDANGNELNRFDTLQDVDWVASIVGTSITDTNKIGSDGNPLRIVKQNSTGGQQKFTVYYDGNSPDVPANTFGSHLANLYATP